MKPVQYTVRLPAELDKVLCRLAEREGVTTYAMLQQSVKAGIAAQSGAPSPGAIDRELLAELASVSTRLDDLERMLDRTLYAACAAYCYARGAAMGGGKADDIMKAEIDRIYDRQRAIAEVRP